jgi:osmotically inducible protein OsmC
MTTAYLLGQAGYDPEEVHSEADVTLERSEDGFSIPSIELATRATVPDATESEFAAVLERADAACPVSRALNGPDIEVAGELTG